MENQIYTKSKFFSEKRIVIVVIVLLAAGTVWRYRFTEQNIVQKLPEFAKFPAVASIVKTVSTPPPLVGQSNSPGASLTSAGVIAWTNTNRKQNGNLPALAENAQLDKAAELKVQDMFKQQYFEHINPQGIGPGELAKEAGYDFIKEGENLALGNFANNQDLLTAWMNSPGHRANILDPNYQQIGVAVAQGVYEGNKTWLAVQEFGKPAGSCPSVDANLKTQIDKMKTDAGQLELQLAALKNQMDSADPLTQGEIDAYNQVVASYNSAVAIYNNKVDTLKLLTGEYNSQVNAYNACLTS